MSDFRHGTPRAYDTHGCRCDECHRAWLRYHRWYKLDRARWGKRTVSTVPVRRHLEALLADGWTAAGISEVAGVSDSTVRATLGLRSDSRGRMKRHVAAALMAVSGPARRLNPNAVVDANGTRLRLEALLRMGWRYKEISEVSGIGADNAMHAICRGYSVTVRVREGVRKAYDELGMKVGPSWQTRDRAIKLGYLPPLALEDHLIDVPGYDPGGTRRRIAERMVKHGKSTEEIAAVMDVSEQTVRNWRRRCS